MESPEALPARAPGSVLGACAEILHELGVDIRRPLGRAMAEHLAMKERDGPGFRKQGAPHECGAERPQLLNQRPATAASKGRQFGDLRLLIEGALGTSRFQESTCGGAIRAGLSSTGAKPAGGHQTPDELPHQRRGHRHDSAPGLRTKSGHLGAPENTKQ